MSFYYCGLLNIIAASIAEPGSVANALSIWTKLDLGYVVLDSFKFSITNVFRVLILILVVATTTHWNCVLNYNYASKLD